MDGRKDYEELLRRPIPDETMPADDRDDDEAAVHHHASDENPNHRGDFMRLVDARARKPAPKD
jgi:hypothetical protein